MPSRAQGPEELGTGTCAESAPEGKLGDGQAAPGRHCKDRWLCQGGLLLLGDDSPALASWMNRPLSLFSYSLQYPRFQTTGFP